MSNPRFATSVFVSILILPMLAADDQDALRVGVQTDGSVIVPTNQRLTPAGKQITFSGRPVDLAFADDGKTLVVKNKNDLVFVDLATETIKQTLALPSRTTMERGRIRRHQPGFSVVGLQVENGRV